MQGTSQKKKQLEDTSDIRRSMRTRGQPNRLELYQLKRTILSWLIYTKTIVVNTLVHYMAPLLDRSVLEGTIKSNGILCHCCSTILTVMEFQQHAGYQGPRPYANIFVEPRISLLACMVNSLEKTQKASAQHVNDNVCVKIINPANFRCCSKCGFKYDLLHNGKKNVPEAPWLCPYCICKSCGKACADDDGCITCSQCEKCYHWKCYANGGFIDLNTSCSEFCDHKCRKVHEELWKKVGTKNELQDGFSWTLLRKIDQEFDTLSDDEHNIVVCHSKLAIARTMMDECFPATSKLSGINQSIFNSQNNFKGSYTVILEKNEEIISIACLRIHGQKIAELPFIATAESYRKQGMCKRLMFGIESTLCHLQIENMVIASTKDLVGKWIRSYGFKRIKSNSLKEDLRNIKTLMFYNHVTRLQKTLTVDSAKEDEEGTV